MFGKKKEKEKEKVIRVCLKGEEVYRGTMTDLPLKEEIILSKSDEFFNDPNPCFIHRSAVRVRLIAELEEAVRRRTGSFGTAMQTFREWISQNTSETVMLKKI